MIKYKETKITTDIEDNKIIIEIITKSPTTNKSTDSGIPTKNITTIRDNKDKKDNSILIKEDNTTTIIIEDLIVITNVDINKNFRFGLNINKSIVVVIKITTITTEIKSALISSSEIDTKEKKITGIIIKKRMMIHILGTNITHRVKSEKISTKTIIPSKGMNTGNIKCLISNNFHKNEINKFLPTKDITTSKGKIYQ